MCLLGSYAFFNQGPLHNPLGNKPYHSQSHIDFSNHFAFSNVNTDQVVPQHFTTFTKHPSQNELQPNHYLFFNQQQNDDFTRNLVPPPPIYKPQGEMEVIKDIPKHIDPSASINNPQLVHGKVRDGSGSLVVQLQPTGYNHFQHQKPALDLEITKENFKEYHTTLAPVNYKPSTESYLSVSKYTKPKAHYTKPARPAYEVTEEKEWADHLPAFKPIYSTVNPLLSVSKPYKSQFSTTVPEIQKYQYQKQVVIPQDPTIGQFLPTPYNPENTYPTLPTQTDVSTIYAEVSQMNRKKTKNPYPQLQTPEPTKYNIKEVATHFPIYEETKPDTQISIPVGQKETVEYENEVTTKKPEIQEIDTTVQYVRPTQQTTFPTRGTGWNQRRPGQRRRRPSRPTTTTTETYQAPSEDNYDNYRTQEAETERPTERPYHHHRRRRPMKYRTTEPPQTELVTISEPTTRTSYTIRRKPHRGQPQTITEEEFVTTRVHRPKQHKQHKYEQEEVYQQPEYEQEYTTRPHTRPIRPKENYRSTYRTPEETTTQFQYEQNVESEAPTTEYIRTYTDFKYPEESITETTEQTVRTKPKRRRLRPTTTTTTTTTEILPTTNIKIPENELDYTTVPTAEDEQSQETFTIREINDFASEREPTTILATSTEVTSTTTTTTETPTTATKSNRIRQRPMKYDVQRPRFSVKDYRQRLSQYMSTSTESSKPSSETPRIRYPIRFKTATTNTEEDSTEPVRQKFVPKDPRHRLASTESNVEVSPSTTEKYIRSTNTRIRPFGRYRSTTEQPSTTTQKVSIKPNIFTNLKRPQQLSLRNRIFNKRRNNTQSTTEAVPLDDYDSNELVTNTEKTEVTLQFEPAESKIEVTTQVYEVRRTTERPTTIKPTELTQVNTFKTNDVLQDDEIVTPDEAEAFLQLQRISDLTSSAHKQYNTPGMFKSVSPTSRRVPSYFTIATEDPILPIEAFFPNLNHKSNEKQ